MYKTLHKDDRNNCEIIEEGDGCQVFKATPFPGYPVAFNVNYVPADQYVWFCQVVGRQFNELADRVEFETKRAWQKKLQKVIGIK